MPGGVQDVDRGWVAAEVPKSSGQLSVPICVPAPSPLSDGLAGSVPKFWAVTVSVNLETWAFFFLPLLFSF